LPFCPTRRTCTTARAPVGIASHAVATVATAEIAAHGFILTPGRFVGAEEIEDDGEPFDEKMARLVAELHAQFVESARLEQTIRANLNNLGFKS
jgi:type I restriction enzyme M protein